MAGVRLDGIANPFDQAINVFLQPKLGRRRSLEIDFGSDEGLDDAQNLREKLVASLERQDSAPLVRTSRLHLTEESKLEFSRDAGCATVRHAPGNNHRCHAGGSGSLAVDHANNVTQVLGIRAFGSQLLCEQVVGRGLRRLDYTPDPATGLLTEEYVDVYASPSL
ncbi:MAG TPA: hypothetical protein VJX94_04695 [Stellaceae bacterium]|nr:hypothetical protein [Stellaceae bacterium]